MTESFEPKNIEQLMAKADELIQQINSDVINDMKEEHRVQFEKRAQNLKRSNPKFKICKSRSIKKNELSRDVILFHRPIL